jgi:flagellar hook-associated protein 1 FlgK
MAEQFAKRVNTLLGSGTLADGVTPGPPLFTYDSNNGTNVAKTLAVSSTITAAQLAASLPGPPVQSNGVPLALSQLADPQDSADQIQGESVTTFYGDMASRVGNALTDATNQQQVQQAAVAQAQNLRQQQSGVDLNEEAMKVIEFQRAYEATARMVAVLNQLTLDTIQMLPA